MYTLVLFSFLFHVFSLQIIDLGNGAYILISNVGNNEIVFIVTQGKKKSCKCRTRFFFFFFHYGLVFREIDVVSYVEGSNFIVEN